MPRFVLLLHECPAGSPRPTHCDLMLEAGEALRTWSLVRLPTAWQCFAGVEFTDSNCVVAEQLADHRPVYLDMEGPVSGDRGSVKRLDAGTYAARLQTVDRWLVDVAGEKLFGEIELLRTASNSSQWQLTYRPPAPFPA